MVNKENPSYYSIIPATLRYDKRLSADQKLLFSELTVLTNAKGYAYPSNSYLSNLYNVSERTIINWLNKLEELDYIKKTNIYDQDSKRVIKRNIQVAKISYLPGEVNFTGGEADFTRGTENSFTRGGEADFTVNNTSINSTRTNTKTSSLPINNLDKKLEPEFETFWQLYPKRVAKKNAFEAFKTARKKVSLETIINGLKIYCVNIKAKQTEEKYIKYPQGWLNGERWTDGLDPEAKEQFEAQQRHARMIAEMEAAEHEDE